MFLDDRLEPHSVRTIERHTGFVEEPKGSRHREEAGEGEAAPLTGREGADRILRPAGEAEGLEGGGDAFRSGAEKGGLQEKGLGDAEKSLQTVGESHEMQPLGVFGVRFADVSPFPEDGPRGRSGEAREEAEEARLAAAVRPEQEQRVTWAEREAHGLEDEPATPPAGEPLGGEQGSLSRGPGGRR